MGILCIPAKVGSSLEREFRLKLNKQLPDELNIEQIPFNKWKNDPHNASYYFCNESFTKIFFVRDPLTRLVSGYLDKCTESVHPFGTKNYHVHCRRYLKS